MTDTAHVEGAICPECNTRPIDDGYEKVKRGARVCFTCYHWLEMLRMRDDATTVRVNGAHYQIAPADARGMRGFDGRLFEIEFFDGRRVSTTNLWTQGTIPPHFSARLPDNARWATRCVSNKRRFATEAEALTALAVCRELAARGDECRKECRVYHCDESGGCDGWHLSSKPARQPARSLDEIAQGGPYG